MLTIDLGELEFYDGASNQFVYEKGGIVRFEYSLKAVYDWESRWKKPFLKGDLTDDELIDFYKTMALDPVDERFLTSDVLTTLAEYVQDGHTATTFSSSQNGQNGNNTTGRPKVYTAEEIYALMFNAHIPLDFENRNLNRLLTILRILHSYNSQPKKMSKQEIMKQNASLNAERKAKMNSRG